MFAFIYIYIVNALLENIVSNPVATILRVLFYSRPIDTKVKHCRVNKSCKSCVYKAANCYPVRSILLDHPIDRYISEGEGRKEEEKCKIAGRKWCNVRRKTLDSLGSSWKIARVLACLAVSYLLLIQRISAIPRSGRGNAIFAAVCEEHARRRRRS